eukprot:CAMPEP_0119012928 /NCGR_PEP_ID=MMETSP1176-20130426/7702_1 /TAXON_ID=265551 /ORGANISM="Synedropsis recta cf, Strain CCMP1620" /LENGTH=164 /DNA_ID=CAMNT_0006965967 /DNA_START=36 /DNA_END=530 /DNA_ORIENTATION=+
MTIILSKSTLLVLLVLIGATSITVDAFTVNTAAVASKRWSSSSSLNMVVGPKQALMMEKKKNPAKFEKTIQGLMKSKKLSRPQAEQRYGTFLLDPDGFALAAAAQERKVMGDKDWKAQAIRRSDDPEATAQRIATFQRINSLKGTAIIVIFFGAVIVFNTMNPL